MTTGIEARIVFTIIQSTVLKICQTLERRQISDGDPSFLLSTTTKNMSFRRGLSWFQPPKILMALFLPSTFPTPHEPSEEGSRSTLTMIGSQNSHGFLPHLAPQQIPPKHLLSVFLVPCVAYIDDKASPVILSTSHGTQPQCALCSFYSHRFYSTWPTTTASHRSNTRQASDRPHSSAVDSTQPCHWPIVRVSFCVPIKINGRTFCA